MLTFTEEFVFRLALVVNNVDFDEEDYFDSKNVHFLVSFYSGSLTVVLLHTYIQLIQVRSA